MIMLVGDVFINYIFNIYSIKYLIYCQEYIKYIFNIFLPVYIRHNNAKIKIKRSLYG